MLGLEKKTILSMLTVLFLCFSMSSHASVVPERPTATTMVADFLVVRPVLGIGTLLGGLALAFSSPFSILGGNFEEVKHKMVVKPFNATFKRCLGCSSVHMIDQPSNY